MPKLPGVNHEQAVRALKKAGFEVIRHGKHIVMSDGVRVLIIPRANPINAYTMGGIIPIAEPEFTKVRINENPLLKVPPARRGNRVGAPLAVPLAKRGEPKGGGQIINFARAIGIIRSAGLTVEEFKELLK